MKALKMLGVAVLAVATALVVVDVTHSDSGTEKSVLCKAKESPCKEANVYPKGTKLKGLLAKGRKAELTLNIAGVPTTMRCQESAVEAETEAEKGEPQLPISLQEIVYTGCTWEGTACEVNTIQLPFRSYQSFDKEHQGDGSLEMFEAKVGSGQPGVVVHCKTATVKIECIYKSAEAGQGGALGEVSKYSVKGGNPATLEANGIPLKAVPGGAQTTCPGTEPKWSVAWLLETPKPLYDEYVVQE